MFIFVTDFVIFLKTSKYNELEEMASALKNFKNIFSRPLFTTIFRPKDLILVTDSILRVKTMYESVK